MSRIPNFASTCTNTGCFVWWAGGGTGVRSHGTGPDRRCAQTPWSPLSDLSSTPHFWKLLIVKANPGNSARRGTTPRATAA